jgi:hypothetical protein
MFDYEKMTVDELKAVKEEVTEVLKAKRADAKASASAEKDALDKEMREAKLAEGDTILIKFGKGEFEATVKRVSDKSVTVEFVKDGETVKRYRKYSEIVKIVARASEAKATAVA